MKTQDVLKTGHLKVEVGGWCFAAGIRAGTDSELKGDDVAGRERERSLPIIIDDNYRWAQGSPGCQMGPRVPPPRVETGPRSRIAHTPLRRSPLQT